MKHLGYELFQCLLFHTGQGDNPKYTILQGCSCGVNQWIVVNFLDFQQRSDPTGSTFKNLWTMASATPLLKGEVSVEGNFEWFRLKWWMVWVGKVIWITAIIFIFILILDIISTTIMTNYTLNYIFIFNPCLFLIIKCYFNWSYTSI